MKKFFVFTIGFVFLFSLLVFSTELLSGIFLTSRYVPDVSKAWNASASLPQEVEIFSSSSSFSLTLLFALLSATVAYFIAQKFPRHN
ncbi:hypothetical protein ABZ756_02675 [Mammaliicoccus sciuri]|uniref:hypothetical protein n=1 Tax=Sporosarcina sp. FSL K6-3508 TaxID=2921557 RepID=UPI00315B2863